MTAMVRNLPPGVDAHHGAPRAAYAEIGDYVPPMSADLAALDEDERSLYARIMTEPAPASRCDPAIRAFESPDLPALQAIRKAAFEPVFKSFREIVGEDIARIAFAHADAEQAKLLDGICQAQSGINSSSSRSARRSWASWRSRSTPPSAAGKSV